MYIKIIKTFPDKTIGYAFRKVNSVIKVDSDWGKRLIEKELAQKATSEEEREAKLVESANAAIDEQKTAQRAESPAHMEDEPIAETPPRNRKTGYN